MNGLMSSTYCRLRQLIASGVSPKDGRRECCKEEIGSSTSKSPVGDKAAATPCPTSHASCRLGSTHRG